MCLGAPDVLSPAQQHNYKAFFHMLPDVIPCSTCSDHLRENLKKMPIDNHLSSNKDLFAWSVQLHNVVNKQLGKPQISIEEANKKWKEVCENKVSNGALNDKNDALRSHIVLIVLCLCVGALIGAVTVLYFKGSLASALAAPRGRR